MTVMSNNTNTTSHQPLRMYMSWVRFTDPDFNPEETYETMRRRRIERIVGELRNNMFGMGEQDIYDLFGVVEKKSKDNC